MYSVYIQENRLEIVRNWRFFQVNAVFLDYGTIAYRYDPVYDDNNLNQRTVSNF